MATYKPYDSSWRVIGNEQSRSYMQLEAMFWPRYHYIGMRAFLMYPPGKIFSEVFAPVAGFMSPGQLWGTRGEQAFTRHLKAIPAIAGLI